MKIEIITKTTTEIEIELPYYCKISEVLFCKIISDQDCISIELTDIATSIQRHYKTSSLTSHFYNNYKKCEPSEFYNAFHLAIDKLNNNL